MGACNQYLEFETFQYLLKIGSEHVHCIDQVTDHWDISYL